METQRPNPDTPQAPQVETVTSAPQPAASMVKFIVSTAIIVLLTGAMIVVAGMNKPDGQKAYASVNSAQEESTASMQDAQENDGTVDQYGPSTEDMESVDEYNDIGESDTPGEYPQASDRYLSADDLQGMSKDELQVMRNEIYARHCYIFKTEKMQEYFSGRPWYSPLHNNVDDMLSDIEKANIKLIKSFE